MKRTPVLYSVLILLLAWTAMPLLGATTRRAPQRAATKAAPRIDPQAAHLVKVMSAYLSSLNRFSVHADTISEGVLPNGQRLASDRSSDVYVQRPNGLRVDMVSAARNVRIYYDGKNATIYSPVKNYYGQVPAAATIDQTLTLAEQRNALSFPAADLLYSDPYQRMMRNVTSGAVVGKTLIDGVMTNHLAFRRPDMDWQIFIDEGSRPLPRRIIITDKLGRGQPQRIVTLSNWNLSPTFTQNMFAFVPPPGAQKIAVATVREAIQQRRFGAGGRAPAGGGSR